MKLLINREEIANWKPSSKILECYTQDNGHGFLDVVVYYENEQLLGDLEYAHEVIIPHCMISDFIGNDEGRAYNNELIREDACSNQSIIRELLTMEKIVSDVAEAAKRIPPKSAFETFAEIFKPEIAA